MHTFIYYESHFQSIFKLEGQTSRVAQWAIWVAAVARVLGEEAASKQFGFMINEREKNLVLEEEIERKS